MKFNKIILPVTMTTVFALMFSACGNITVSDNSANNVNKSNTAVVSDNQKTPEGSFPVSNTGTGSARSKTETFTPAKDSPERTAIMDALRVPVEKELKQEVIFVVDKLKMQGDWAFIGAQPKSKNGGEPNWKITKYQEFIDHGDFEKGLYALLKNTDGRWSVIKYMMNCHDVCYLGWDAEYKAPKQIFE